MLYEGQAEDIPSLWNLSSNASFIGRLNDGRVENVLMRSWIVNSGLM